RCTESFKGLLDIIVRMHSSWNKPIDNVSLGNNGIYNDRAKYLIVLTQIHHHSRGFFYAAFHVHWRYHRISFANIKAAFLQSFLKFAGILPQLLFHLWLSAQQFKAF